MMKIDFEALITPNIIIGKGACLLYHLTEKLVLFLLLHNCPHFRYQVLGLLFYFTIKTAQIQSMWVD